MIRPDSRSVFARAIARTILAMPFLAVPFAIWTTETWLQMQIFGNDYEQSTIRTELARAQDSIKQLEERTARLKTLRKLEASVPNTGLVEPTPGQIRVIRIFEADLRRADDPPVMNERNYVADARDHQPEKETEDGTL